MENRGESFLDAYPNSEPLSRLKYNLIKTSHFTRNHPITLLPQQDFGPRGPRPEEAYIVTPTRNMNKYILVIPQKNLDMFILSPKCALG